MKLYICLAVGSKKKSNEFIAEVEIVGASSEEDAKLAMTNKCLYMVASKFEIVNSVTIKEISKTGLETMLQVLKNDEEANNLLMLEQMEVASKGIN